MAKRYIVGSKGFLKEFSRGEGRDRTPILIWTTKLREAAGFTTKKQANAVIKNYELDCFIWAPHEEEHDEKKYSVCRRSEYHSSWDETDHNVLEWIVVKNLNNHKSDIRFLLGSRQDLYDFETATRIAREKNQLILSEITKILNNETNN